MNIVVFPLSYLLYRIALANATRGLGTVIVRVNVDFTEGVSIQGRRPLHNVLSHSENM